MTARDNPIPIIFATSIAGEDVPLRDIPYLVHMRSLLGFLMAEKTFHHDSLTIHSHRRIAPGG
jgi:hypothetical protein